MSKCNTHSANGIEESFDVKGSVVFISHSSQDKEIADKVTAYLELHNQVCWIAPRDIPPGADWAESILDGIDTASGMILIVSAAINDSPHIRREVERAVSNKIPIYPIIIEKFQYAKWIQYYISAHQWIDASSGDLEIALNKIVRLKKKSAKKTGLVGSQQLDGNTSVRIDSSPRINELSTAKSNVILLETRKNIRKKILSRTFIWFFVGCGIFIFSLFLLREAVDTEESLRESFLGISGVYRYIPLYALLYALFGLIIGIINDAVFAKKAYSLSAILMGVYFGLAVLVTNAVPSDLESYFFFFLIPLPLFLLAGLIISWIVTFVSKWINK